MNKKPLILVTNDDGITAPGLRALVKIMSDIGEVIVVAPDSPRSAMGHAITINSILHCKKIKSDNINTIQYSCSGTPADCVKLAINEILDRKPDICVSGINHGSNSSINVVYSGTMSAAIEAGIQGVPSIGFSLLDFKWNADFKPFKNYIEKLTLEVINNPSSKNLILNVNLPKLKENQIKGIKICRQANTTWLEKFDKRSNPMGEKYYWLTGTFLNNDNGIDTDEWALDNGYISVVPTKFDLTDHNMIQTLKKWNL
jgi:5'-nucleotidase